MSTTPMVKGNKIQVTVQLDPDQTEAVDQYRFTRRMSRAAVMRDAVDLFMAVHKNDFHNGRAVPVDAEAA